MTLAAIDCGSNSTRLLITNDEGTTLERLMRITRLSAGVDATGDLAAEALERTYATLREFRGVMDSYGVDNGLVVATSAVRDARNGPAFMSMAESITGLRGRILPGFEEAHLSFGGATAGLEADPRPTVVVDVGGGSTEVAGVIDGALVSHSMQLGCVRVTERALGSDPVTPERLAAADAMIDAEIDRAFLSVPSFLTVRGNLRLVGVAGTIATLAHLDQGLATYHRDAVHHLELPRETVTYWRVRLMRLSPAERLAFAGMFPGREDILVGGLRVLEKVMEALGASSIIHSESDILDGTIAWLRR